jgi:uncharacterized membrane protein
MNDDLNQTVAFRAALKRELPAWIRQELVTEENAQRLTALYQLDRLGGESSRLLAAVMFTIGGLLLGGGAISFVAANWEAIPVAAKVVLLFVTLIAFHATGWWLWQRRGWTRLGHALVFSGCLVFGANIGLMAQIFHVSGEWYGAFGAWALGSLVMAWAAQSWITGVLVIITSFVWFSGLTFDQRPTLLLFYPVALAATLIPLAWRVQSRVLNTLTLFGVTASLCVLAGEYGKPGRDVLPAMTAGGLLAWAAGEAHRVTRFKKELGNAAAGGGLVTLALAAHLWSFHWVWKLAEWRENSSLRWLFPTAVILLAGLGLLATSWQRLTESQARRWPVIGTLAATLLLFGGALLSRRGQFLPTLAANIAALMIAAVAIGIGVIDERRIAFWAGALYLVLLIVSRFLEYETSLLLKSAAFIVCGAVVMFAGVAYERFLHRKEQTQ